MGPNEKPVLSEFRQTIKEVLETSCEGIDYELVDQANLGNDRQNDRGDYDNMCIGNNWVLVRSINATLHKKIKDLVPKRYRFTLQSTLFEEKDQDIGSVYHRVWPLEGATESTSV